MNREEAVNLIYLGVIRAFDTLIYDRLVREIWPRQCITSWVRDLEFRFRTNLSLKALSKT